MPSPINRGRQWPQAAPPAFYADVPVRIRRPAPPFLLRPLQQESYAGMRPLTQASLQDTSAKAGGVNE